MQLVITGTILLVMTTYGCTLFKRVNTNTANTQQLSSASNRADLNSKQLNQTNQHALEWRFNSRSSKDVVMIWPKGKFTFSAIAGFAGEAERVAVRSNLNHSTAAFKLQDSMVNRVHQLKAGLLQKNENELKATTSTKTQSPAFWPLIVTVSILSAGVIIYKFLRNRI